MAAVSFTENTVETRPLREADRRNQCPALAIILQLVMSVNTVACRSYLQGYKITIS